MDTEQGATPVQAQPPGNERLRRNKLRQHAVSLATGVAVFLVSIGLMQAAKPPASSSAASPRPPAASFSGSSGAGSTSAGGEETLPATPPAKTAPAPSAVHAAPSLSPSAAAQIMGMPSVYIHVLNESAREQARLLAPALEKKGIALAGIKVVGAGPRSSDLRYFRPSEKDEAMRVQAALLSLGLPAQRLKSISGFESSAVPRQYELWLVSDYKG
jgi:hypothetical protein